MTRVSIFNYNHKEKRIDNYVYELKGQPGEITISNYTVNPTAWGFNINGVRVDGELISIEEDVCIMKYREETDMYEKI